jgi:NAD(P)-dependent dehydrogenase (short-subunit alcohol dehydrogenase family)
MLRTAVIQGASRGLGLELVRQLVADGVTVFATCRRPEDAYDLRTLVGDRALRLDVEDEGSVEAAAAQVAGRVDAVDLLINVAGLLHDGPLQPEKKLSDLDPAHLRRLFAVNAIGPALVAKHFGPLLRRAPRAVLANVSARVGSIDDNRLGGWYGYRASKAAQNMFTRTMAREFSRGPGQVSVVALHPGTVDTDLSAPFSGRVPPDKLFDVERGARQLLARCREVTPETTGGFVAWDGSPIPW